MTLPTQTIDTDDAAELMGHTRHTLLELISTGKQDPRLRIFTIEPQAPSAEPVKTKRKIGRMVFSIASVLLVGDYPEPLANAPLAVLPEQLNLVQVGKLFDLSPKLTRALLNERGIAAALLDEAGQPLYALEDITRLLGHAPAYWPYVEPRPFTKPQHGPPAVRAASSAARIAELERTVTELRGYIQELYRGQGMRAPWEPIPEPERVTADRLRGGYRG